MKRLTLAELADLRRFVAAETGSEEAAIEAVLRAASLSERGQIERRAPSPIVKACCEFFGVGPDELVGGSKVSRIANARHVAANLLRAAGVSLSDVARLLGMRSRATVVSAARHVEDDEELSRAAAAVARMAGDGLVAAKAPVLMLRRTQHG